MAEKLEILGETVCYCSSCKLELNHRITLMDDDDKPSKALCLTCNKEHKYRKNAPKSRAKKASPAATPTEKAKARQSSEEKVWEEKINSENVTPASYKINGEFEVDEVINHAKFGRGLVIGFEYPDKLQIYFSGGVKILKGKRRSGESASA